MFSVLSSILGFSSTPKHSSFTCKDEPVENHRPIRVRVIGAGYSGVYFGIRIPQRLRNVDLVIYEKNSGVGGTWFENQYPGCACDIPAHSYQYSFAPNESWSNFYAPSKEICEYIQRVSNDYGASRFIRLNHQVTNCVWDQSKNVWHVTVKSLETGEEIVEETDVLISARGSLNDIAWPTIPGLDKFQGKTMHSAAWDTSFDFRNKTVGVIGGGSSSIQIIPELQRLEGVQLHAFVRNKVWISNRFGDHGMAQLGLALDELEFSEARIQKFKDDPNSYLKFRKIIENDGNLVHKSTIRGSEMQTMLIDQFQRVTREQLVKKPELAESFLPEFGIGCRRLTPGPGFLDSLVQDNVDFVTTAIASINEKGLVLVDGRQIDLDVLACATGFNTSCVPPFPVVGLDGLSLAQRFNPLPESYLTLAVDGFPNYFMMLGPNAGIGAGSLTPVIEGQADYIIKCIRKLQKEDYVSMAPKAARVKDFSEYVGEYFKKTVYTDKCKSWYKAGGGLGDNERITALYPGSLLHALEAWRAPRWEDFEYTSKEENKLRWLGNGWSSTLMEGGGDPSWYLNPGAVDVPPKQAPEKDRKYFERPFSH